MNKDWVFAKPIAINDQKQILVQCRNCQELLVVPNLPTCTTCQVTMNLCSHGIACEKCSYTLILAWIKEGNLLKGALPREQLARIKEILKEKFKQEVYEEEGYLRVREVKDA